VIEHSLLVKKTGKSKSYIRGIGTILNLSYYN
jgi:hypothetical protein